MKISGNACILLRNYFILGRERFFFYGIFLISKFIIIVRGNKFL